jgi:hypothetical protein
MSVVSDTKLIMKEKPKRKYREYQDEEVIKKAAEVKSLASLLRALNLKPAGGNYAHMKKTLQRLNIDTSHWKGQGWSKGEQKKDWADYSKVSSLKPHLIKKRGNTCEICNLALWLEKDISLEVHHIDGDRTNNKVENLQLLCPNCHSFTDNWRSKKGGKLNGRAGDS